LCPQRITIVAARAKKKRREVSPRRFTIVRFRYGRRGVARPVADVDGLVDAYILGRRYKALALIAHILKPSFAVWTTLPFRPSILASAGGGQRRQAVAQPPVQGTCPTSWLLSVVVKGHALASVKTRTSAKSRSRNGDLPQKPPPEATGPRKKSSKSWHGIVISSIGVGTRISYLALAPWYRRGVVASILGGPPAIVVDARPDIQLDDGGVASLTPSGLAVVESVDRAGRYWRRDYMLGWLFRSSRRWARQGSSAHGECAYHGVDGGAIGGKRRHGSGR